jgi:hypothetical protein
MSTYNKNGMIMAKFNLSRSDAFDEKGKKLAFKFFSKRGGLPSINDKDDNDNHDYSKTDIKVFFPEKNITIFVEAEVKSERNWEFISSGVDIPIRKIKYALKHEKNGLFFMVKNDELEVLLIPMKLFTMAFNDCGDDYIGQGSVLTSTNFSMPEHGCHRVRKFCNTVNRRGIEDFIRIPLRHVYRYYNPFKE